MSGSETADFRLYCAVCGWEIRASEDGDRTDVNDSAIDHHLETGHTPIRRR